MAGIDHLELGFGRESVPTWLFDTMALDFGVKWCRRSRVSSKFEPCEDESAESLPPPLGLRACFSDPIKLFQSWPPHVLKLWRNMAV